MTIRRRDVIRIKYAAFTPAIFSYFPHIVSTSVGLAKMSKKPPFQYEIGGFSYAWVSLSFAMTNAMTNFAFSAPPKLHYASI
mgnify:CR=1 FL=1